MTEESLTENRLYYTALAHRNRDLAAHASDWQLAESYTRLAASYETIAITLKRLTEFDGCA